MDGLGSAHANIATHDKSSTSHPTPAPPWQTAFSYVCFLGWAGGQGTDGRSPPQPSDSSTETRKPPDLC